jgi:thiol:disulfide interchange protein DsbD
LLLFVLWATLLGSPPPVLGSLPVPETATAVGAIDGGNPRVEARLLLDVDSARPGDPVQAGVLFDLDRGWHIYWRNPGQSGLPTELDWEIERGTVGPIAWPAPEVFQESGGLTTYGYHGQVLVMAPLTFEARAPGERVVRVEVDFVACQVRCIPGRLKLSRPLRVERETRPADDETRAIFERYADRVPGKPESLDLAIEALYSQSAIRPGDSFRAAVVILPCAADAVKEGCRPALPDSRAPFVPDRIESIELRVTGTRPHPFSDGGSLVTLEGHATTDDPGADQRLRGVLAIRAPDGEVRTVNVDLPLPRAGAGAEVVTIENPWLEPVTQVGFGVSLWKAILLAFLGGIILNAMPCVLPVLTLKLCAITELAHRSRGEIVKHGLAYTAGILVTMVGLATTVAALRAAGIGVGWGFQFQEPLFIAAISSVLLVFALNLFGVFEITVDTTRVSGIGSGETGARRSFFEGLLAVILATPCSAPFLGTAVGFAFASSTPIIIGIFVAVGFGLAAPYLLVTCVPGWAKWVPRPGPWMIQVRRILGFALMGTVVWLLWVMGRSLGVNGLATLLAFLFGIAFVAWIYGSVQAARLPIPRGGGLVLSVLAVGALLALPLDGAVSAPDVNTGGTAWRAFDPAAIRAELDEGRPVFVTFTADWCLTCKANERFVIADARVEAEFERYDVATFKADWTRRDETIRAELARFGRAGVPMYLVYNPSRRASPQVLPELLTVDGVIDALRGAAQGRSERT